ncbi:MAG: hypothetical protein HY551_02220 [Elusimicrobia bacterium]|nr:hypothetical protein [Elusimicrobiota bacterium]
MSPSAKKPTPVKKNQRPASIRAAKPAFLNLVSDHMTLLVQPSLYNFMYAFFRIVLGVPREEIIYEKRRKWPGGAGEVSMTFAAKIGEVSREKSAALARTAIAVVQPSEPSGQSSHVRTMLDSRGAIAHWQHVALRTPDLLSFHRHAAAHGVNFITPILKDQDEDLLQVFTGELFLPGTRPSGIFFEFVQRDLTPQLLRRLASSDRQSWFRDRTFLGLYGEKEREYQSGRVTPILDHALMDRLQSLWRDRPVWSVTEEDLTEASRVMREYVRAKSGQRSAAAAP